MNSLTRVVVRGETLLLEPDGGVHGPFSLFLNSRFSNPHSREVVSDALRILYRFLGAYKIDLPRRALEGRFLAEAEQKRLERLVKHELRQIESMHDRMIQRHAGVEPTRHAPSREDKVAKNTSALRLHWTSAFFDWYQQNILDDGIRSVALRNLLKSSYTKGLDDINRRSSTSKEGHHNKIRSLPAERYLQIMREVLVNPEEIFVSDGGGLSATWQRDRAITLLAMEGMRPGAIGNIARDDYWIDDGCGVGYLAIKDNLDRRSKFSTTNTPKAKGINNASYASNLTMKLWNTTCFAMNEYEQVRDKLLEKLSVNKSKSFFFLGDRNEPISSRSTISAIFRRVGSQLKKKGLLDKAAGDPYVKQSYDFTAYTLRHSAISFFYEVNRDEPNVNSLACLHFGWTSSSRQPQRYANRAMRDHASALVHNFVETLYEEVREKRHR